MTAVWLFESKVANGGFESYYKSKAADIARFGERICAVVEPEAGAEPTLQELSEHVRGELAAYKAPRELVVVETIGRAPNGKVDYKTLKERAIATLGAAA